MARVHIGDIVIDFSGARAFVREVRSGSSNTDRGHRRAAEAYRDWLQTRYLAEGFGEWPALLQSTIDRKGHDIILRETDAMMNSLLVRKRRANEYTVGIWSKELGRRSDLTIQRIATIHQTGDGIAQREIVVPPDGATFRSMTAYIREGVKADIRKANNASRSK